MLPSALALLLPLAPPAAEPVLIAPKVGLIEVYGLRRIPVDKVRRAMQVTLGDPMPKSRTELETRVEAVSGIVQASVEAVCCEDGRAMLFVGVVERGSVAPQFRDEPGVEINLPDELAAAYQAFIEAAGQAARAGNDAEDLTKGHSLMSDPRARAAQERLLELAASQANLIRQIAKEAAEPDQRAIAAYILQYIPDKKDAVDDLQLALRDPADGVRLNAMRALRALAVLASTDARSGIKVLPTWFIELLNSTVLSDRLEACRTLSLLTTPLDENTRDNLKERALASLFEMARWQHLPYALPAFLLLGRVAGYPDASTQAAWSKGERDKSLDEWRRALKLK